ncbi:MAG: hypothetical protein Kow0088_25150 [Anaerolineales bacterium]
MSPLRPIKDTSVFYLLLACLSISGVLLRIYSFHENSRLYGDVNLFALSARQLASSGQLTYPMKYDFTPEASYLSLESPASQHPPLWPLLGAILARLWGSENTFLMLKVLSLCAGFCLWLAFLPKPSNSLSPVTYLPFALIAFSPWLVDFSTNGSSYILIAFILLLAEKLWGSSFLHRWQIASLAGSLCAFAILTHYNLILLPLSFAIRLLIQENFSLPKKLLNLGFFLTALILCLSPWFIWNRHTFGQWFHSPSSYYLLEQLNLASITLDQERVVWKVQSQPLTAILSRYGLLLAKSAWAGMRQLINIITPLGFIGLLVAMALHGKKVKESARTGWLQQGIKILTAPLTLYLLTILLWATYKVRFLIPLLPPCYLLIGESIRYGQELAKKRGWLGWLGISFLLLWSALPYQQKPLNFYYGTETPTIAQQYDQMKALAIRLAQQPQGVVLGISNSLDGGIETIYWAKQPFVMARGVGGEVWKKLSTDFGVRYVWAECGQTGELQTHFPTSELLLSNGRYCIFSLK